MQAESIIAKLGAPVLIHAHPKPAPKCIELINKYFRSLRSSLNDSSPILPSELVVIGDRVTTDIIMSNSPGLSGSLSVLTTSLWQKESMLMRRLELGWMRRVREKKNALVVGEWEKSDAGKEELRLREFVKLDMERVAEEDEVVDERAWWERF